MKATAAGRWVARGLLVALIAANAAGYAFNLYVEFWWFDRVLHGCTIFALTLWLAVFAFGSVLRAHGNAVLAVLLLASVGVAVGALWEVAEWAFDNFTSGDIIKGKHDTILDIIMDTAGALGAAILGLRLLRPPAAAAA